MNISARNQLKGKVVAVEKDGIMVKVKIAVEPATITAVITREAVETLGIKENDKVLAIIKATQVMVGKE